MRRDWEMCGNSFALLFHIVQCTFFSYPQCSENLDAAAFACTIVNVQRIYLRCISIDLFTNFLLYPLQFISVSFLFHFQWENWYKTNWNLFKQHNIEFKRSNWKKLIKISFQLIVSEKKESIRHIHIRKWF